MTRIFASPRKMVQIDVVGQSVVVRDGRKARVRTFRNRYTLRKFLYGQVAAAQAQGLVSVNR